MHLLLFLCLAAHADRAALTAQAQAERQRLEAIEQLADGRPAKICEVRAGAADEIKLDQLLKDLPTKTDQTKTYYETTTGGWQRRCVTLTSRN